MSWLKTITAWAWLVCCAAHSQSPPLPDLLGLDDITQEQFEPAVGRQIRLAYAEASRDPHNAEAVGKLGMILQAYGKYQLAEICYRRARALAPGSFRWAYYLGNVEGWLGKAADAITHIRQALRIDKDYVPARIRLAELLFESGAVQESEKLYRESIRQKGNLASAHYGLGRVLAGREDWVGAIEHYRRACEIFSNYPAAYYALGIAYRKTGDTEKARENLEQFQRAKQHSQPSEDQLMETVNSLYAGGLAHFAKGSTSWRLGKLKEAATEFESALKVNPNLTMAHVNLIAMYGQLGMPDKAREHFRAAIALDPGWVEAYYNWGLFLFQQKRTAEAAEAFAKAVELNPNYGDAHAELGLLLDQDGKGDQARRHYQLALESNPGHRQARYLFGLNLIRSAKFAEAITQLLETIKVEDSKTPICMRMLATAYERAGDRERAAHYYTQARQRAVSLRMEELASELERDLKGLSHEARPPR